MEDRRRAVLEAALAVFARQGYRRTSMEEVAAAARISRPGLYLHVASKEALLRAAVEHALTRDVTAAEAVLDDAGAPLRQRLLLALDLWAGQYVGPLAVDLDAVLEHDAPLLGDLGPVWSARFRGSVEAALTAARLPDAEGGADVVLALTAGLKRSSRDRDDFRQRLDRGLQMLLGDERDATA